MHHRCLLLATAMLIAACGDMGGGCACMEPVQESFVPEELGAWSGQVRLTQTGLDFVEQNMPQIVASFVQLDCPNGDVPCPSGSQCNQGLCMENGQPTPVIGVRIPPSEGNGVRICHGAGRNDCNVYVRINSVGMDPRQPSHLDVSLNANISSTGIKLHRPGTIWPPLPTIRCTVHARAQNKRIQVPITLRTDNPLERLAVEMGDIGFSLDNRDIELCGALDWPIIKDIIMAIVRGDVEDMLDEQVADALGEALQVGCNNGRDCPGNSQCVNGTCQWNNGQQVPVAIGVEGLLDLGDFLEGIDSKAEPLEMALLAGGAGSASASDEGLTLGLMGGSRTEGVACVPSDPLPPPDDLVPLTWANTIPGGNETFHFGLGVASAYLNHGVRAFHRSGGLCLGVGSGLSEMISANTFALLMPSMRRLLDGHSHTDKAALELRLRPRQVPKMEVGLGRYETDDEGNRVLTEPLLHLMAEDFALEMQLAVAHRFVRLATIVTDLHVGLALDINQDNELMLIMGDSDQWISNIRVEDADILVETEAEIAEVMPTLLELAMPMLAGSLDQSIALPELQGFSLELESIRGERARLERGDDGFARYDYMAIYASLGFTPPGVEPMTLRIETQAQVMAVDHGETDDYAAPGEGQLHRPTVELALWATGAGDHADYEYTWRVDEGLWHPFQPFSSGDHVLISSPIFSLVGDHQVEIRARVQGIPRSLDPDAAIIDLAIDPAPSPEPEPTTPLTPLPLDHGLVGLVAPDPGLHGSGPATEDEPPGGWSCTAVESSLLWLLALAPLRGRRRREYE